MAIRKIDPATITESEKNKLRRQIKVCLAAIERLKGSEEADKRDRAEDNFHYCMQNLEGTRVLKESEMNKYWERYRLARECSPQDIRRSRNAMLRGKDFSADSFRPREVASQSVINYHTRYEPATALGSWA